MTPPRHAGIERLSALWHGQTAPAIRRACVGVAGVALAAALLVARTGAVGARAGALGLVVLAALAVAAGRWALGRRAEDARRVLATTIVRTQPDVGYAALRALGLAKRTAVRPATGSPALAELHLGRVLGRA